MILYFFAGKRLTIKFTIIFRQRCFEMSHEIKKLLILSRDVLLFEQKL